MSRRLRGVTAAALLALAALTGGAAASQSAGGTGPLVVELDRRAADAGPGEKIAFTSTVRNTGDRTLPDLIAHLNILTKDPDVYVDPEDWSPERTQYLRELAPGGSAELRWSVQAVTSGPLVLYVAVTDPATGRVTASESFDMTVGGQRVVNAAGVLPLVAGPPAVVLVLIAATAARRRMHR